VQIEARGTSVDPQGRIKEQLCVPTVRTVSAWCSRRSSSAEVRVLSLLKISGHFLKARLEIRIMEQHEWSGKFMKRLKRDAK